MKVIPFFIITFIISAALVVSSFVVINTVISERQSIKKISIGITLKGNDTSTKLLAKLIAGLESFNGISEFEYLDEETARARLQDGSLEAVILTTDNMIEDINTGVNTPAEVLVPEKALSSQLGMVFRELIKSGESLIRTTEAGVYSVDEISSDYGLNASIPETEEIMTQRFMRYIMNREDLFSTVVLSGLGDMTFSQYYLAAACLLLLTLFGTGFSSLYGKNDSTINTSLSRIGIGPVKRCLLRILTIAISLWIFLLAINIAASIVFGGIFLTADYIFELLWLAMSEAVFIHLIYTAFSSNSMKTVIYVLLCVIMAIVAGGVFPTSYMPKWIEPFSFIMPLKYWREYTAQIMFTGFSMQSFLRLLAVDLILAVVAVYAEVKNE